MLSHKCVGKEARVMHSNQINPKLDYLSDTDLTDVCLLANIMDDQTTIAILKIVCEMHDLRVSILCEKG